MLLSVGVYLHEHAFPCSNIYQQINSKHFQARSKIHKRSHTNEGQFMLSATHKNHTGKEEKQLLGRITVVANSFFLALYHPGNAS
jgi:hypothetical protein